MRGGAPAFARSLACPVRRTAARAALRTVRARPAASPRGPVTAARAPNAPPLEGIPRPPGPMRVRSREPASGAQWPVPHARNPASGARRPVPEPDTAAGLRGRCRRQPCPSWPGLTFAASGAERIAWGPPGARGRALPSGVRPGPDDRLRRPAGPAAPQPCTRPAVTRHPSPPSSDRQAAGRPGPAPGGFIPRPSLSRIVRTLRPISRECGRTRAHTSRRRPRNFGCACEPSYQSGTLYGEVCQLPTAHERFTTTVCVR